MSEETKKFLIDFGYTESDVESISNAFNRHATTCKIDKLKEINKYFFSLSFSSKDIIKMIAYYPVIYVLTLDNISKKVIDLCTLGYSINDVKKIIKNNPSVLGYSIENIKEKLSYLFSLGYTKKQIIKITYLLPPIIGYSIENIESKINNYNKLGIPKEDIIKMSLMFSGFYSISEDNVNNKIKDLINLGFTYEQVIKMIKLFPPILGLSIETIKEKIDFYRELNILDFIIENPKCLMQSVNLSYARYMFYLMEKNDVINSNTSRRLFVGDKQFSKQFKVTKKELLKRYSYEESRSRLC